MCTEVFGKIIVCRFTMRHKLFFDVLEKLKCCFKKAKHAALFFFFCTTTWLLLELTLKPFESILVIALLLMLSNVGIR